MQLPVIQGIIERRILVNFRVDPAALAPLVPLPFRPKLVDGAAIAGICLIRLAAIRPRVLPASFGVSSENAAHRIAVEWRSGPQTREGVYIPRRDSSSRLNRLLGGRLFPGMHHPARFDVRETGDNYRVEMRSRDGATHVLVDGRVSSTLPSGQCFARFGTLVRFSSAAPWAIRPLVARACTTGSSCGASLGGSSRSRSARCDPASSRMHRGSRADRSSSIAHY